MITNSSNAFSKPDDTDIVADGYAKAKMKLGKDPICPYLPGTTEYRIWYSGWNKWIDEQTTKERNNNGN